MQGRDRDPVAVAVVGYGYWGSKHVRVLAGIPDIDVTIVDHDPDRLADAARTFPAARTATALDEVLEAVDAVVVASPPASHHGIALAALAAGRHCLVEKPLAVSSTQAQELVDAAAASGVHLMVGHTFEYNAAVWKLKEIISSGELGQVFYIDTARLSLGRYQNDCNVVWDLAPHDISIVTYLLDEIPSTVSVWSRRNVGRTFEDLAYIRMEFPRTNASAFVHVSWLDPQKVRRVTVAGEAKMAVYDDLSDERVRVYDKGVNPMEVDSGATAHAMPVTYRSGDIVSPYISFTEPLLVQDSHFVDCVRAEAQPRTPGTRGLEIVRVLEAIDAAAAYGAPAPVGSVIAIQEGAADVSPGVPLDVELAS
jgi:predicted dehydrogenase